LSFFCILLEADTCKAGRPLYLCTCLCAVVWQIFDVVMQRDHLLEYSSILMVFKYFFAFKHKSLDSFFLGVCWSVLNLR